MDRPFSPLPRPAPPPAVVAFEVFTVLLALGSLAILVKVSPL